jgi:hypothetical protein
MTVCSGNPATYSIFFRLLAREQVVSGALLDAFEEAEGITQTLFAKVRSRCRSWISKTLLYLVAD